MEGDSFEVLDVTGGWAWGCLVAAGAGGLHPHRPAGAAPPDRAHASSSTAPRGPPGWRSPSGSRGGASSRWSRSRGDRRKDPAARREALNEADFAVLCLPDDAAREAVSLLDAVSKVRVIDASTAHRVTPGWVYGFPESRSGTARSPRRSASVQPGVLFHRLHRARRAAGARRAAAGRLAVHLQRGLGLFGRRQGTDRPVRDRPRHRMARLCAGAWGTSTFRDAGSAAGSPSRRCSARQWSRRIAGW